MFNFVSGVIFGIIAATIGFGPIAKVLDGVMLNLQKTTVEVSKPQLPPPVR
jgi:membrane associated rhomboid family serine protease